MNKYIIKIDNVWKTYTMGEVQVHALRGLNLEIKHGEFLAIKGPSGSGKSTAMNMIGALDVPTKGSVYLEGKDISKFRESNLAQLRGKKIGFIFQQFNLINTLSAIENVMLPMVFLGMPVGERQRRAKKLLSMVGLDKRYGH
ncbi:ATP-binding cassette domain-containing protein, partial [archaeon]|nr:ATP-binding cassette domain-containing protein [archaeon]